MIHVFKRFTPGNLKFRISAIGIFLLLLIGSAGILSALSTSTVYATEENTYSEIDPDNNNQYTISGTLYRDLALDDCDNLTECKVNRTSEVFENWEVRLYRSDTEGEWVFRDSKHTNSDGEFIFSRQYTPGTYYICQVNHTGWTQAKQTWSGSGYKVDTVNESGANDEGAYCASILYTDASDKSYKAQIGTVDTQKPVGTAVYFGGKEVEGIRYIKSIHDLSFTETITDNHSVVRATILVKKFNTVTDTFDGFCGNWNALSLGSYSLDGTKNVTNTVDDVEVCRSNDLSEWPDGTYQIFHGAYDETGNEGKYNLGIDNRQYFVIDSTYPEQVSGVQVMQNGNTLGCNASVNNRVITVDWDSSTDENFSHYLYQADADKQKPIDFKTRVNSSQRSGSIRDIDGTYNYRIRAVDISGNKGKWSNWCGVTLDRQAPETPTAVLFAEIDNSEIFNGGATRSQFFTYNLASFPDVSRYQLRYWNDINGSSYKESTPWNPSNLINYSPSLGTYKDNFTQGEGTHYFSFSACDLAGNCSAYSEPYIVTFDTSAPSLTLNNITDGSSTTRTVTGTTEPNVLVSVTVHSTPSTKLTQSDDNGNWSLQFTNLEKGLHSVEATSTDGAGNVATETGSFTVTETQAVAGATTRSANYGNQSTSTTTTDNNSAEYAVLGSENENPNTTTQVQEPNQTDSDFGEANVLGANDSFAAAENLDQTSCSKILGVCWYVWIPVIIILPGIIYFFGTRHSKE
ncbi:hypothetical protein KC946_01845 [Candidatus Saccharibacteria bacterium]|nr:hypothetical protein [Candidatus Saccharibacteria bacterium]